MREEFTNKRGQTLVFTDTHLLYKAVPEMKFISYDKITKIKCGFIGMLDVKSNDTVISMAITDKDKSRVKELVDYAKNNPQYFNSNSNFREEFVSLGKQMSVFTSVGIEYYSALPEETATNYRNIEQIDFEGSFIVVQELNKGRVVYTFNNEDKERMKNIVKKINKDLVSKEKRIRCNVCGHIYCYTKADIDENNHNKTLAGLHSFSAAVNAIGGTAYNMHEEQKHADAANAKIIDFSKCPKCNSSDIIALTDEEWQNINNKSESTTNSVSTADELKKFKDLLDNGVITQEEFDAKKKQLLGL